MAVATIPVLSREYVWVPVAAEGEDAELLTTLVVEFAFLVGKTAQPVDADWVLGDWATTTDTPTARCLIGPTAKVLAAGTYYVWVRVTGATERPVRLTGQLKIA